jgi:DNA-binding NarL/FixJ family response regulator
LRVLLVDDHHLFRQGLKYLLADLDRRIDFFEAHNREQALAFAVDGQPMDLVLLDLYLPGGDPMDNLGVLRRAFDSAVVVVVSGEDDSRVIRQAIENGAAGFVPKASTPQVLIAALRLVLAGGIYLPPHVLRDSLRDSAGAVPAAGPVPRPGPLIEGLSARQLEVLLSAVHGKANKVIAREMKLSEGTVKAHLSAAFRALGVQNRTEAVFVAASLGLGQACPPMN